MTKAVIISPYHAQSHAIWTREIVAMFPEFSWRIVTLPPRFFGWRIRGNALALLFEPQYADAFVAADLLVATSMTDLASLKGLCPALRDVPSVLYFHENQFAYPANAGEPQARNLEAKLVTLYAALAADRVLFNSKFNYKTFTNGARAMLANFPDHAPQACIDTIEEKSSVIPVPLSSAVSSVSGLRRRIVNLGQLRPIRIVWNHRWEYDKAPDRLAMVIKLVAERGINCEFSIVGQQFRNIPESFEGLQQTYPELIKHFGFIEDASEYHDMLMQQDVVLSTALHDFQGLSILEAVMLGCVPLVPDRLAYQQYIPAACRYPSYPNDPKAEASELTRCLECLHEQLLEEKLPRPPDLNWLCATELAPQYRAVFHALLAGSKHS